MMQIHQNDAGKCSVLLMLEVPSASDTVDPPTLLNRVMWACLCCVMQWLSSYLSKRLIVWAITDPFTVLWSLGLHRVLFWGHLFLLYLLSLIALLYTVFIQVYVAFLTNS